MKILIDNENNKSVLNNTVHSKRNSQIKNGLSFRRTTN